MFDLVIYDYIAFGLGGALLVLTGLYVYFSNKHGEKFLWLKALCSLLFVAVGALMYVKDGDYLKIDKLLFAAGVVICLVADLVIGASNIRLRSGMLTFAAAQILFSVAMIMRLEEKGHLALYLFLGIWLGLMVLILTGLKMFNIKLGNATIPAIIYAACLCASTALGFASITLGGSLIFLLPVGFGLFLISDGLLGYNLFKAKSNALNYVCLYAYYCAMLALAFSIGFLG